MAECSASKEAFNPNVAVARLASYPRSAQNLEVVEQALARLADILGWSNEKGPFGRVIPSGARVLIKPNLVLHANEGPGGMECLVTHASIIRSVADAALGSGAAEVLIGDAPIQGCDFDALDRKSVV